MDSSREVARRGMLKLMLRLPSLRRELQVLWQTDAGLEALCEAYQDATTTFDRLHRKQEDRQDPLLEEYRNVCLELEGDVRSRCLARSGHPNKEPG
ncbi:MULTISPECIES: hypothetical protein [unclassified Rhizobium]|uniref:hypothetical protein n=1 Tax=unclassified Rhizobium TaxID=2613769 RepID=UPI001787227E|nr:MULTISPECIES: hypothetical protein [unclassified Rhizobium]MBD8687231.1 hypothetical protein [Rhizobium sp. CFBP 13644]MBD8690966.1 hypothetical protein [Rhizobium sp. CFBP 13717]